MKTGTNGYADALYPEGWKNLDRVELLPWPTWYYSIKDLVIKKEIFMVNGDPAVWTAYTLIKGLEKITAELKFLFTYRNSHQLTNENNELISDVEENNTGFKISPYHGLPSTDITFSGKWSREGDFYWDRNIFYKTEKKRGHEFSEDRFVPGNVLIELECGSPYLIRSGIGGDLIDSDKLTDIYNNEKYNRLNKTCEIDSRIKLLKYNSAHFLMENNSGKKSVNAGYPWFGEWGRDTMIALPGLELLLRQVGMVH